MQKNKRVLVLGGGVSGLSLAYYLKGFCDVVLLEKSSSCGGFMTTEQQEGFFFENGPRTFKASKSETLLSLIKELGLEKEILFSSKEANKRYIYKDRELCKIGARQMLWAVFAFLREWRVPKKEGDESIYDFVSRRLSKKVAKELFDPLAVGMFGGDSKKLSILSCFPDFKKYEQEAGSILKGALKKKKKGEKKKGLFTLRKGVGNLIDALEKQSGATILLHQEVIEIKKQEEQMIVRTLQGEFVVDAVVSALPCHETEKLFSKLDPEISLILKGIDSLSMNLVQVGYSKPVLRQKGFGYLIPTWAKEPLMGVVFDSDSFPEQNQSFYETRMTMMWRDLEGDWEARVKQKLKEHLKIVESPDYLKMRKLQKALPQYFVGHFEKISNLERLLSSRFPNFYLAGNYLEGVSVNDCIKRSRKIADLLRENDGALHVVEKFS